MSGEQRMDAVAAGFTVPVFRAAPAGEQAGRSGIGGVAIIGAEGLPVFALTLVHSDGTILAAELDEAAIHRVAEQMADFLEALPAITSGARH